MKELWTVILFALVGPAFSIEPVIKDPSGLLNTIDTYLGYKTFDESFIVGDKAWYQEKSCRIDRTGTGDYSASCEDPINTETTIIEKTTDLVKTSKGAVISRSDYEVTNGNFLRFYLGTYRSDSSLSSVTIEIERISFEDVTVNEKPVKAIRVFYKVNACKVVESSEECYFLPQEMALGRNIPMIGQLLEFVYHREIPGKVILSALQDFQRL